MPFPVAPLDHAIRPAKQEAKRHYGSHPYFTKRAWNVVQEYIKHFSSPGDTVLDPFGGSGVTSVESLALKRKAIYLDLNPWACFLAKQTALAPVDLSKLHAAFEDVEQRSRSFVEELWRTSNETLAGRTVEDWYPKGAALPANADVRLVEELFTPRMLHGLARIRSAIQAVRNRQARDLLLMVFSATLVRINRTFLSAANRTESRGGSAIFSLYRYKVARKPVELPLWPQFVQRFRRLAEAKRETNQLIGSFYKEGKTAIFAQGSATRLEKLVKPASVDYIYTDPPYGGHIAYLDLSTMWFAWLKMKVTEQDRQDEVIEGGAENKSRDEYLRLLAVSMKQMHEALKAGGWLSVVFAHRDTSYWEGLVQACEAVGFAYRNTVVQPVGVVWSMHKKKNPLKVLSGELVLNFRKERRLVRSTRPVTAGDPLRLVRECCERTIISRLGATTEELHHAVVPLLLGAVLLERFSQEHGDLVPLLKEHFAFDAATKTWHVADPPQLVGQHDESALVRYFTARFLAQRGGKSMTLADVQEYLRRVFPDGGVPKESAIREALQEATASFGGRHWHSRSGAQQTEMVFFRSDRDNGT